MAVDISDLSHKDQQEIRDLIARKRRGVPKAKYIWIKKDNSGFFDGTLATRIDDYYVVPRKADSWSDAEYFCAYVHETSIIEWVDVERPF